MMGPGREGPPRPRSTDGETNDKTLHRSGIFHTCRTDCSGKRGYYCHVFHLGPDRVRGLHVVREEREEDGHRTLCRP